MNTIVCITLTLISLKMILLLAMTFGDHYTPEDNRQSMQWLPAWIYGSQKPIKILSPDKVVEKSFRTKRDVVDYILTKMKNNIWRILRKIIRKIDQNNPEKETKLGGKGNFPFFSYGAHHTFQKMSKEERNTEFYE